MEKVFWGRVAGVLGFLAVALGAFGAHGLKSTLAQHGTESTWQTAATYHMVHAVAILAWVCGTRFRSGPAWCFLAGIALFSGSLYGISVTGWRVLGVVTPLGGVAFLAGWAWIALSAGTIPGAAEGFGSGSK